MDYLRSCYKSSMRLYPDRPDVLTPGRWYFCPPGALVVNRLIAAASSRWDFYGAPAVTGVGEVTPVGEWVNGRCPPQFQGRHYCGTADAWLHGIPYADRPGLDLDGDNVPLCCRSKPYNVVLYVSACGCGYANQ